MRLPLAAALLLLAPPAVAGPAADAVKFFYAPDVKFGPALEYRDRFAEPVTRLFELNDKAQEDNPDMIACIDFDPGLDAQDFDQETLSRTLRLTEALNGDEGTVTATFDLFPDAPEGGAREMVWSVKKLDGRWKIADIASKTNGWTLSELRCVAGQSLE